MAPYNIDPRNDHRRRRRGRPSTGKTIGDGDGIVSLRSLLRGPRQGPEDENAELPWTYPLAASVKRDGGPING